MKINEFNTQKQIDEGMADNLLGSYDVPQGLKNLFFNRKTVENPAQTQKIFTNSFYTKAMTALNSAIQGGIVDKSITQINNTPPAPPTNNIKPNASKPNTPVNRKMTKKPDNFYGSSTPSNVGRANPQPAHPNPLSAPTIKSNNVTTTVNPAMIAPATGGITSGGLGYQAKSAAAPQAPKSATAPQAPKQAAPTFAQQTVAAAQQHRQSISNAQNVQAAGKAAAAKLGFQRTAADKLAMKAAGLSENSYHKLNVVFESIVEASQPMGIYQYMKKWYSDYMGRLNWKEHEPQIDKVLQQLQATYNSDGGKQALSQLANITYAIASASAPTVNRGQPTNIPTQDIPTQDLTTDQIKANLLSLKNKNPYEYDKLKRSLP